jgi:hypothetical protein
MSDVAVEPSLHRARCRLLVMDTTLSAPPASSAHGRNASRGLPFTDSAMSIGNRRASSAEQERAVTRRRVIDAASRLFLERVTPVGVAYGEAAAVDPRAAENIAAAYRLRRQTFGPADTPVFLFLEHGSPPRVVSQPT